MIKALKTALGLGLGDAKTMTESAPTIIKTKISKKEAETLKTELEGAGATITLK